ncbi:hypothetical protein [Litoreibacter roseus]|uniref:Flagellar assembly protein FliH n=1 Tax=Litoreibacter roseus TaxID=2601869 RepID=A0A6N6JDW0_9RHOB|nr:hypothetical protein [Litoreibacter roseus]GFE64396.1 hypothetical protein KIN_14700 [Litoreibacter roseus]
MSKIAFFEDFANPATSEFSPTSQSAAPDPEALRDAHDNGYRIGYQDGAQSTQSEQDKLRSDISTALQETSFTYFEARQHVLKSMRPLLEVMVGMVLPEIAKPHVANRVVEEIIAIAGKIEAPLKLLCAPDAEDELRSAIEKSVSFPVELIAEETLDASQVIVKYDGGETVVDTDALLAQVSASLSEFFVAADEEDRLHA